MCTALKSTDPCPEVSRPAAHHRGHGYTAGKGNIYPATAPQSREPEPVAGPDIYRRVHRYTLAVEVGVHVGAGNPCLLSGDAHRACGDLLRALYYRLREIVLESDYIQVDESTVPVINNEKHRAVKAYLWVVRSVMKNLVFFHYDKGSIAQRVVINFCAITRVQYRQTFLRQQELLTLVLPIA